MRYAGLRSTDAIDQPARDAQQLGRTAPSGGDGESVLVTNNGVPAQVHPVRAQAPDRQGTRAGRDGGPPPTRRRHETRDASDLGGESAPAPATAAWSPDPVPAAPEILTGGMRVAAETYDRFLTVPPAWAPAARDGLGGTALSQGESSTKSPFDQQLHFTLRADADRA
jgi:hypothetical protein